MRGAIALVFVLGLVLDAQAQEHGSMRGFGAAPCGQFSKHYKEDPSSADTIATSWALGFLSGFNYTTDTPYDLAGVDYDSAMAFLRQYCEQHPLKHYYDGVFELAKTLPRMKRPKN